MAVAVPEDGLVRGALPRVDYADAFRLDLGEGPPPSLDAVAHATLGTAPGWVVSLMKARNALVRPLGLKVDATVEDHPPATPYAPGARVGIFRVFARGADELLLGEDDRHLDFRVSLRLTEEHGRAAAVMTTLVRYNNWLGRAYFLPVGPFHRVIVPAMLRAGGRKLRAPAP
ncbi:MAG: DUF2867 domain-containing protein [Deltaproteobacteria bacterium]|nr:DUF2867 domain-containing protein [Deltaproteobacteria bacterium]